jgi:hypothetical protein
VLLGVEQEPLGGDLAVQVDGELGDGAQRAVDPEQPDQSASAVAPDGHPPRQPEITVEPAVEEHAAVRLDRELPHPGAPDVGARLDAQVGAVGVRADDAEAVVRLVPGRRHPGDQAAAPHDVAAAWLSGPGRILCQPGEPRLAQDGRHGGTRVEGRRGGIAEGQQAAGGVQVGCGHGHDRTILDDQLHGTGDASG